MIAHVSSCRHSDSTGHHISRLRPFDWPLYLVGFVPIRCKNCGNRSYRHRLARDQKAPLQVESSKLD